MHITKQEEIQIKKIISSFLEISNLAIKQDPKNPKMNAEIFLPGLEYMRDIFNKEIIIDE